MAPRCLLPTEHFSQSFTCCCCSAAKSCLTLCNPMNCSTPGFPVLHHLPEFAQLMSIESVMPSHPLLSPSPPAFNLSQHQGLFQRVSHLHQVAKVLELQISPSNEFLVLIFFEIDWFDLLAVQGTLKSVLQHYSSKASVLWCLAFFMVQLSHCTWLLQKT